MESRDEALRPDELLAQLGWVRALARRLVADPDVTDDVLQQVCLLALQQAPRDARSGPRLRAWLATVTRTLVWSTARADSRRVRREQTAAQPEAQSSTDDIVVRREALRSLVDAVTSLEEPYFSVIVERDFDGRSVAEIAVRHGASAATVRQRLTRARYQLRTRLHALLADERHGWLRSALPILPGPAVLTSAPAKPLLVHVGGLLVAKTVGTGGVAKVLAVLAFVALFLGGGWSVLREGRQGASTTAVLPTLRGWVASGGQHVAGTRVRATGTDETGRSIEVTQDCNTDGSYVLELKQQGDYRVHAEADGSGWSPSLSIQAVWGLDLAHEFELGTASLAGRVVDAGDGSSPVGMAVRLLRDGEAATGWITADATGVFQITWLHAGSYAIETRSDAHPLTTAVSSLHLEPGEQLQDVIVPVSRGAVVEGLVIDARGEPAGAWVYLIDLREPSRAEQHGAPKGAFRIQGLASGSYRLVVAGASYADELADGASASTLQATVQDSLEIELDPGEQVKVTLRKVH